MQGSFIPRVLSAASAAHCGTLILYVNALYLLLTVPTGISLSLSYTYLQSFNFRSILVLEILMDEKKVLSIIIQWVSLPPTQFETTEPQLC